MAYVYILYSESADRFYIGYTQDLEQRIATHRSDEGRWTKGKGPWQLQYYETFDSTKEALKRERKLKKAKSKKYLSWLVLHGPGSSVG